MARGATRENERQPLPSKDVNHVEAVAPAVHTSPYVGHVGLPELVGCLWTRGLLVGADYLPLGACRLAPPQQPEYSTHCLAVDRAVQLSGDLGCHASRAVRGSLIRAAFLSLYILWRSLGSFKRKSLSSFAILFVKKMQIRRFINRFINQSIKINK